MRFSLQREASQQERERERGRRRERERDGEREREREGEGIGEGGEREKVDLINIITTYVCSWCQPASFQWTTVLLIL